MYSTEYNEDVVCESVTGQTRKDGDGNKNDVDYDLQVNFLLDDIVDIFLDQESTQVVKSEENQDYKDYSLLQLPLLPVTKQEERYEYFDDDGISDTPLPEWYEQQVSGSYYLHLE